MTDEEPKRNDEARIEGEVAGQAYPYGMGDKRPLSKFPNPQRIRENVVTVYARGRMYEVVVEVVCGSCNTTGWYAVMAGLGQEAAFVAMCMFPCWKCGEQIRIQGPIQGAI